MIKECCKEGFIEFVRQSNQGDPEWWAQSWVRYFEGRCHTCRGKVCNCDEISFGMKGSVGYGCDACSTFRLQGEAQ